MTTETDTKRAESQAKAQYESIQALIERLEHARECDQGHYCKELPEGRPSDTEIEQYHNEVLAQEAIQEHPLFVLVRTAWHAPGAEMVVGEFEILLRTGGTACRIMGALDDYGCPARAWLEYQDWGTPWTQWFEVIYDSPLLGISQDVLLAYAREFYYGS